MAHAQRVLIYQHRKTASLIDGRIYQTFDVLGHPGLVIHWKGWTDGEGNLTTDVQYFETQDGRRFDPEQQDDAILAWEALQVRPEPMPPTSHMQSADIAVRTRRHVNRSVIPSRLKALDDAGIPHKQIKDGHYRVYGDIEYYPATGYWHALKSGEQGYTVEGLIAEARKQDKIPLRPGSEHEPPAMSPADYDAPQTNRPDAVAVHRVERTTSGIDTAASVTGGERPTPSASLLPAVTP